MKAFVVALILAFGTLQTVSFVQCCCGPLCSTPGELCKDHEHQSRARTACSTCGSHSDEDAATSGKQPGKDTRCTHIAPVTEVSQAKGLEHVHIPVIDLLEVEPPGRIVQGSKPEALREAVPRAGPPGRLLYLLDSALLI